MMLPISPGFAYQVYQLILQVQGLAWKAPSLSIGQESYLEGSQHPLPKSQHKVELRVST